MSHISFAKKARSSFFANPASCETLLSRTSISRFAADRFNKSKNFRAFFFVKPMVEISTVMDIASLQFGFAPRGFLRVSHSHALIAVCRLKLFLARYEEVVVCLSVQIKK